MGIDVHELQHRHGSRARNAPQSGGKSVAVAFDASAAFAGLDAIVAEAGKHVRAAAQVGADVLYRETKLRAPESKHKHYFHGTNKVYGPYEPGNLRESIYQVYSKDNSTENKVATYHVSWNFDKAPYGFMVEFGTSSAPAHPFLRPAYDAVNRLALDAANDTFENRMAAALPGVLK